jgi:hypothetical protein
MAGRGRIQGEEVKGVRARNKKHPLPFHGEQAVREKTVLFSVR